MSNTQRAAEFYTMHLRLLDPVIQKSRVLDGEEGDSATVVRAKAAGLELRCDSCTGVLLASCNCLPRF